MRNRTARGLAWVVATSVAALVVLGLTCSIFEGSYEDISDVEAALQKEQEGQGIPSLAAAVIRDGAVVWETYLGYADLEQQVAAGESTIYVVASVSKLVVLTAALQLWENGKLDLDADVSNYLPFKVRHPRFPDDPITCLHLMTHTSGLAWPSDEIPGFYDFYPCDSAPPLAQWLPDFILPSGSYYFPAVWKDAAPGKVELYSNIGASLLAYIVERLSGVPFADYCRDSIFRPLGMTNSSYWYRDLPAANLARPYSADRAPIKFHTTLGWPTADLKTTVRDFTRFLLAWMNGGEVGGVRILESRTVDKALEMRNPASGRCLIWLRALGDWYGHTGGVPGFSAVAEFQRPTGLGVIVCTNMRHGSVYPGGRIHALLRRIADRPDAAPEPLPAGEFLRRGMRLLTSRGPDVFAARAFDVVGLPLTATGPRPATLGQ
jgi:CubicO group peptidase (beta-lactamase class C family)